MPADWAKLYGYRPLLLETLVEGERFRGTCNRAANWIKLGQTTGRGRLDREHAAHGEAVVRVNLKLGESCWEKQRTIDRLKQEIPSLREKGRRLERKAAAGPFGSSTPSAKIPVKAHTLEEQRSKLAADATQDPVALLRNPG